MVCPWLVKTITQANNKNSYNESVKAEHQEFDKCMKNNCPFYRKIGNKDICTRAMAECADKLPLGFE